MTVKGAEDDVRFQVRVTGRVQGVFYRASAREVAERLGLSGFVRNMPDGSVEIEAEGPRERVRELVSWCREGPPEARVSDLEVTELTARGEDRGFRVLH